MSSSNSSSAPDIKKTWSRARDYANLLNPIPHSVNNAILTLWRNHLSNIESNTDSISAESFESIRLAEKSPVLKTPLYFAATSLYPEKVSKCIDDDGAKAVLRILGPGLYAVLLGFVYLHRRLNRICTADEWQTLSKEIVLNMEVGYLAGKAIPLIGPALGTLVAGIRYVALGSLMVASSDQFVKYRNLKKHRFDMEYEQKYWGVNHMLVSAFLLNDLGIRGDTPQVASVLLDDPNLSDPGTIPADLATWRTALLVVEAAKQGLQSEGFTSNNLGISDEEFSALGTSLSDLVSKGSSFSWMFRTVKNEPEPQKADSSENSEEEE